MIVNFQKVKIWEKEVIDIFKDITNHSPENTVKNIEGYQKIAVMSCKMRRHTHIHTKTQTPHTHTHKTHTTHTTHTHNTHTTHTHNTHHKHTHNTPHTTHNTHHTPHTTRTTHTQHTTHTLVCGTNVSIVPSASKIYPKNWISSFSETSLFLYQNTWHHELQDSTIHNYCFQGR